MSDSGLLNRYDYCILLHMKSRDGRKLGEFDLKQLRSQVANIYRKTGDNAAETARRLGVSRYFVIKWMSRYKEQWKLLRELGFSTEDIHLESKKRGRKSLYKSISDEIIVDAKKVIDENPPNQVGINSLLWTERAIKKLFKLKYNIKLNRNSVYEFIRHLVFSFIREDYREIERKIKAFNGYGYVIINGYIYFLRKPKKMKNPEWAAEVHKLVLKQRKKSTL